MKDIQELAVVTAVEVLQDERKVVVDVDMSPRRNKPDIPFAQPGKGIITVPEVGDVVEVLNFGPRSYIARTPLSVPNYDLPENLTEGDVAIKLSDGAYLHFSKQGDGSVDLEVEVDGDIDFRASQIFVGERGAAVPVAKHDHTHEFTYTGGGDNSGSLTGTTETPPAGDATETEVE